MSLMDDTAIVINGNDPINNESSLTDPKEKAKGLLEKAILLNNCSEQFVQEALDLTSKAIEYDPRYVEAWIEEAECLRRKGDIESGIVALEKSLVFTDSEDKNYQLILRKLSAFVRQQTFDKPELKIAALLRSVVLGKQALKADLNDPDNYYNLAKAYMCLFFVSECVDHQLINISRGLYQKAFSISEQAKEKDNDANKSHVNHSLQSKSLLKQSDFLFNYSTVLLYCQEFEKSLDYLRVAVKLDPDWNEPKNVKECIVNYLKQTHSMYEELSKNSKKVTKRYSKVIENLKDVKRIQDIIHLDQQRIMKSPNVGVTTCFLDELLNRPNNQTNSNQGSQTVELLHLKLINMVNCNQAMYITFMAMDKDYTPIVVTIYNLAASTCPTPRDVVTIVNPKMETVSVSNITLDQVDCLTYKRINVREFRDFYVNGFWIKNDQVAKPQYSVSIIP